MHNFARALESKWNPSLSVRSNICMKKLQSSNIHASNSAGQNFCSKRLISWDIGAAHAEAHGWAAIDGAMVHTPHLCQLQVLKDYGC